MHPYARPREPRPIAKENWNRWLSRPVSATNGRIMHTLSDVRAEILAMPAERQSLPAWRSATWMLMAAARTEVDTRDVTIAVEMALHRDGRLADLAPLARSVVQRAFELPLIVPSAEPFLGRDNKRLANSSRSPSKVEFSTGSG